MKSIGWNLFVMFLLTTFSMQGQVVVRDTLLAQRAIFDAERFQFVWAVQESPTVLWQGLTDDSYLELRNENAIWYICKSPQIEQWVADIIPSGNNRVYIMHYPVGIPADTIGTYNMQSGCITDRDKSVYQFNPSGSISRSSGGCLDVGKDVNKQLAVFFLLDKYYMEQKHKTLISN